MNNLGRQSEKNISIIRNKLKDDIFKNTNDDCGLFIDDSLWFYFDRKLPKGIYISVRDIIIKQKMTSLPIQNNIKSQIKAQGNE